MTRKKIVLPKREHIVIVRQGDFVMARDNIYEAMEFIQKAYSYCKRNNVPIIEKLAFAYRRLNQAFKLIDKYDWHGIAPNRIKVVK